MDAPKNVTLPREVVELLEKAREALEPFANHAADAFDYSEKKEWPVPVEDLRAAREALTILSAALSAPETVEGWKPTHRHYKGGLYRVIGMARNADNDEPRLTAIYQDEAGRTWTRTLTEFSAMMPDGRKRFEPLSDTLASAPAAPTDPRDAVVKAARTIAAFSDSARRVPPTAIITKGSSIAKQQLTMGDLYKLADALSTLPNDKREQ